MRNLPVDLEISRMVESIVEKRAKEIITTEPDLANYLRAVAKYEKNKDVLITLVED